MNRRTFLGSAAAAAALPLRAEPRQRFTKSICSIIFPPAMPTVERFREAKNAGFDAIELRFGEDVGADASEDEIAKVADAAKAARVAVASLWVSNVIARTPLNSADADQRAQGVATVRKGLRCANRLGSGAILLVPGRLGSNAQMQAGYEDTWNRVTGELRKLVPYAAEQQVMITPENVWNKFLVSPLEMRTFIDQFQSPWVRSHFDVGNVMQYGYPQDWIQVLGPRIKRVHFKDYKLSARAEQGRFVDLLAGDVDWKAVIAALVAVDYRGPVSPEYSYDASQPDQLRKISDALDKILALA